MMMAREARHLNNAPIEEAMIAFDYLSESEELEVDLLATFGKLINDDYPNSTPITEAQVRLEPDKAAVSSSSQIGTRFASAEGKNTCTLLRHSFLCSRLRPYQDWDSLESEFRRLWVLFSTEFKARPIKVAVRYINKISIPSGAEINDYVNTFPKMAEGLPKDTQNVWVRVEMPIEVPAGTLVVTEVQLPYLPGGTQDQVEFVLDHDLQFQVPVGSDPWQILEEAHTLKNRYFFASITEKLEEQFL